MFLLKTYTRKELALLYFPDSTVNGAYYCLRRWLEEKKENNPDLLKEIHAKKIFPKVIVKQIVELLGEP